MRIKELLLTSLEESQEIASLTAVYEGKPAVFFGYVPEDEGEGWGETGPYPRILCTVRKCAFGRKREQIMLTAEIQWGGEGAGEQEREQAGEIISRLLGEKVFQTDVNVYCLEYTGDQKNNLMNAYYFQVLEYPLPAFAEPDPVKALQTAAEEILPKEEKVPLLCRLRWMRDDVSKSMAAGKTMKFRADIHLFLRDQEKCLQAASSLLYGLTEKEEIDLADGSPVHLRKIRLTADGDGWRKGQLKIIGTYGLARKPEKGHSLTGVKMTEK